MGEGGLLISVLFLLWSGEMGERCWGLEKDGSSSIGNRTEAEKGYLEALSEHWHLQPHC